jgi:hypothetical protein
VVIMLRKTARVNVLVRVIREQVSKWAMVEQFGEGNERDTRIIVERPFPAHAKTKIPRCARDDNHDSMAAMTR